MIYNENMARKTLYSAEKAKLITRYVAMGYTLADAAYAARISTETIRRWRDRYPEFNRQVVEATNQQWSDPVTFAKYRDPKYRGYKRPKIALSEYYGAKTVVDPSSTSKAPNSGSTCVRTQSIRGLPVRSHSIFDDLDALVETPQYYNAENGMVEWIARPEPSRARVASKSDQTQG